MKLAATLIATAAMVSAQDDAAYAAYDAAAYDATYDAAYPAYDAAYNGTDYGAYEAGRPADGPASGGKNAYAVQDNYLARLSKTISIIVRLNQDHDSIDHISHTTQLQPRIQQWLSAIELLDLQKCLQCC